MKIETDQNGYVKNYVIVGESSACGTETEMPEGFGADNYAAYKLMDGALVLDADRLAALQLADRQNAIRARRERECYSVINRGQLWYEGISLARLAELRQWYKAWRDAPATLIIPDRPAWLD